MALAHIAVELRADAPPIVAVNGVQVPVVGVTVRHVPPSMPQVFLELAGEVTLEGEGIVAQVEADGNTAADVRAALLNLDADKLDEQAARLFGEEGPDGRVIAGPGQAFVAAIVNTLDGYR